MKPPRWDWPRMTLAVALGNALGLAAWRFAEVALPWLWTAQRAPGGFLALVGLIALSFILLAAPPVLAGAAAGWLARRAAVWVGLASGLWSLLLLQAVPAGLPLAPGLWYASTVLVLLSGAMGGWMMDLRASRA